MGSPFQFLVPPAPSPAVPEVFSNQLRMNVTFTDFTIVFGAADTAVTQNGPSLPTIRDKVAVHLVPGMLKQLYLTVQWAVEAYETAVGPILLPSNLEDQMATQKQGLIANLRDIMSGVTPSPKPTP